MRQRIAQLEAEKIKLLDRMNEDSDDSLKDRLAAVNKDLATVRLETLPLSRFRNRGRSKSSLN